MSIVVPLYNEQESVGLLYKKIKQAINATDKEYEIIFVDDGSKDATFEKAASLTAGDKRLRVVELRKNYGQTPAMAAGIDIAVGKVIVTMDGDLQNDPSDIPMMLAKLEEGYDLVIGWRHKRQDKLVTRKIPSIIANRLIGYITGVTVKDNGCSLKVYNANLIKHSPFYNEMHRFIPALLSLSGIKIAQVKVKHHARQFGESKYGLSRVYKVLFDLLTIKTILSLSQHPVRWFFRIAAVPFIISVVLLILIFFGGSTLLGAPVILNTLIILFFSLAVFLASLGILNELIYFKGNYTLRDIVSLNKSKNINS